MKNQTAFITKDGVSDADLIRAARDMYEALDGILSVFEAEKVPRSLRKAAAALAKARGVQS